MGFLFKAGRSRRDRRYVQPVYRKQSGEPTANVPGNADINFSLNDSTIPRFHNDKSDTPTKRNHSLLLSSFRSIVFAPKPLRYVKSKHVRVFVCSHRGLERRLRKIRILHGKKLFDFLVFDLYRLIILSHSNIRLPIPCYFSL